MAYPPHMPGHMGGATVALARPLLEESVYWSARCEEKALALLFLSISLTLLMLGNPLRYTPGGWHMQVVEPALALAWQHLDSTRLKQPVRLAWVQMPSQMRMPRQFVQPNNAVYSGGETPLDFEQGVHRDLNLPRAASVALPPAPPASSAPLAAPPFSNRRMRRQHLQPPGTPPAPPAIPATDIPPAEYAGVVEAHQYEQFFYDKPTRAALLQLMARYERPLLLFAPTLAVDAESANMTYRVLDRDERFAYLPGFRRFDLMKNSTWKSLVDENYVPDVVICDPPFAYVRLNLLRAALDMLAPGLQSEGIPLFIGWISKREQELQQCFAEHRLEQKRHLGYMSVKPRTSKYLVLYGPEGSSVPVD